MRYLSLMGLSFCALSVLSCSGNPSFMGRGYSAYKDTYKSAPGAEAKFIGYEYSLEQNDMALDEMRYVAEDLAEKLDEKLDFGVDEIYLSRPQATAFYSTLDHLLRDELTKRGYILSIDAQDAVRVDVIAAEPKQPCSEEKVYVALALNVVEDEAQDVIGDFYDVAKYGFSTSNGIKTDIPECAG